MSDVIQHEHLQTNTNGLAPPTTNRARDIEQISGLHSSQAGPGNMGFGAQNRPDALPSGSLPPFPAIEPNLAANSVPAPRQPTNIEGYSLPTFKKGDVVKGTVPGEAGKFLLKISGRYHYLTKHEIMYHLILLHDEARDQHSRFILSEIFLTRCILKHQIGDEIPVQVGNFAIKMAQVVSIGIAAGDSIGYKVLVPGSGPIFIDVPEDQH